MSMSRIILLLLVITIILTSCNKKEEKEPLGIYYITYHTNEIYNNSVGDDFRCIITCDGIQYKYYDTITYNYGQKLTFDIELIEQDEIPDIGTGKIIIPMERGVKASTEILLTETNGRYKGEQALIEVVLEIKYR